MFAVLFLLDFTEANDDDDSVTGDEVDGDNQGPDNSDNDYLPEELLPKTRKLEKKGMPHNNLKETLRKKIQSEELENSDVLHDKKALRESDCISKKHTVSDKKRKHTVTFKSPQPNKSGKRGKVTPCDSKTGKAPVKKGKRDLVDKDHEGSFRVDQTLAGSFADVGDVFGKYFEVE